MLHPWVPLIDLAEGRGRYSSTMPARAWTPARPAGSRVFGPALLRCVVVLAAGCGAGPEPTPAARARPADGLAIEPAAAPAGRDGEAGGAAPPEASLGVVDRGIYTDLDPQVQLPLPRGLADAADLELVLDAPRGLAVLYEAGFPLKAYPTGGTTTLAVGHHTIALRPGDRSELSPLAGRLRVRALADGEVPAPGDRDGDGLPDPLDLVIGGVKNALNAAPYIGGYQRLPFPGGDVPRDQGVCTDVIVRAARNAGIDLQLELHRDIVRAPRAYPMVVRANPSIDHRRVKTVLPYFVRQWEAHGTALDDPQDPLRPGDVVFMDTFPGRPGPDHVGIVSATTGPSGRPLVINAWTEGFVANEMDLLDSVPLTHRFRVPPAR
jgi:uncharacterized protein